MQMAASSTRAAPTPAAAAPPLTLLSWNVAGISRIIGEAKFYYKGAPGGPFSGLLNELEADVIGFQEAKICRDKLSPAEARCAGYESFWSLNKKGYAGVCTFVKNGPYSPIWASANVFGDPELDEQGRCVVVDIGCACVFNVYVPNAGDYTTGESRESRPRLPKKMAFLRALSAALVRVRRERGKPVILMGDLNISHRRSDTAVWCDMKYPYHGFSQEEVRAPLV